MIQTVKGAKDRKLLKTATVSYQIKSSPSTLWLDRETKHLKKHAKKKVQGNGITRIIENYKKK